LDKIVPSGSCVVVTVSSGIIETNTVVVSIELSVVDDGASVRN
jgi:hypothetical protein